MNRCALVVLGLLLSACGPDAAPDNEQTRPAGTLAGYPSWQFFVQHDWFLPATDPSTVPRARADYVLPDDEVFGVVEGGQARAYPVTMIAYYHVVNDIVGGVPIAVTY